MNQETPAGQAAPQDQPVVSETSTAASQRPVAPKLPSWAPLALLAIVPALIVGIVVYLVAGSDGTNNAGAVEGFLRLSSQGQNVDSFKGETPPGFPAELPVFKGARVITSFLIEAEQGVNYFVVYNTSAPAREVYDFYRARLDDDPWQVEVGSISREVTGLSFSSPVDADITGDLTIFRSDLEDTTVIYVSFQDLTSNAKTNQEDFKPESSLSVPDGWPSDVAVYDRNSSIIIQSYFQRDAGVTQYYISFITKDPQTRPLDFYNQEFGKKGWTVTDSTGTTSGFSLGLEFHDANSTIQGSVSADTFQEDDDYTEVNVILQVDRNRTPTRGN